jgi:hypothetical protein
MRLDPIPPRPPQTGLAIRKQTFGTGTRDRFAKDAGRQGWHSSAYFGSFC